MIALAGKNPRPAFSTGVPLVADGKLIRSWNDQARLSSADSNSLQRLPMIRVVSGQPGGAQDARGSPEVRTGAIGLGGACVVDKPIEMQGVADLVARVLDSSPL